MILCFQTLLSISTCATIQRQHQRLRGGDGGGGGAGGGSGGRGWRRRAGVVAAASGRAWKILPATTSTRDTHFEPCLIELYGILWRGEQHLPGPSSSSTIRSSMSRIRCMRMHRYLSTSTSTSRISSSHSGNSSSRGGTTRGMTSAAAGATSKTWARLTSNNRTVAAASLRDCNRRVCVRNPVQNAIL